MKILFAEDEKELSEAITLLLRKNDYSIDPVYDGKEALDYISCSHYDLIILDIMMPKVDGLTVLKQLRSDGNKTPVLLLTAKSQPDDIVKGLDLGADDYLTKPFNISVLLARIRVLTRQSGTPEETVFNFGNMVFDKNDSTIKVKDSSVKLLNKERKILDMLIHNTDKIVSPQSIIDSAWDSDDCSTEENVYVFISYLRRKMKQINASCEIKAFRNQGYQLVITNDQKA